MTTNPTYVRFAELDPELRKLIFELATHTHNLNIPYPQTQQAWDDISTDADPNNNPPPGGNRVKFTDLDLSGVPQLQNLLSSGFSSLPPYIKGEEPTYGFPEQTIPDGVQTVFQLRYSAFPGSEVICIQGIRQKRGVNYNLTASTLTFITPPPLNSELAADYEPMVEAIPAILPRYIAGETPTLVFLSPRTYTLLLAPIQGGLNVNNDYATTDIVELLCAEQVWQNRRRLLRGVDYSMNTVAGAKNIEMLNSDTSVIRVDYQPSGSPQKLNYYTNQSVVYISPNVVRVNRPLTETGEFDLRGIQVYYNSNRLFAGLALDYTVSYTSGDSFFLINFNPTVTPVINGLGAAANVTVDYQCTNNTIVNTYSLYTKSLIATKPIPTANIVIPLTVPNNKLLVTESNRRPQVHTSSVGRLKDDGTFYTFSGGNITLLSTAFNTIFPGVTTNIKVYVDYQVRDN